MSELTNTWIGYFDRTYEQAKEAITARLGIEAPELSDHTESNPLIIILDVFLAIAELMHYYIDNVAREVYLHSARKYRTAQLIARLFNYRLRGVSSSSVTVVFTSAEPVTEPLRIPINTVLLSEDIQFLTQSTVIIPVGRTEVEVTAVQQTASELEYTSTGNPTQIVEISPDAVDLSLSVFVAGVQYEFKSDLFLSSPTDLHYTTELNSTGVLTLVFGNGVNGIIPAIDSLVVVQYFTSLGVLGNVPANEITAIETQIESEFALSITNPQQATGGSDIETLDELKRAIPASIRTRNRAVTEGDFKDIAEGVAGVSQAFVDYDCGAEVDLYIVPSGNGDATDVLIESVRSAFYEETRLVLMDINILAAGRIAALIEVNISVLSVYNRATVLDEVRANIASFLSSDNQQISGSVRVGDIYQIIENTEGVDYCDVVLLSTIPEETIRSGARTLDWDRQLLQGSTIQTNWTITMTTPTEFTLRRGNTLVGRYNTGERVNLTEVSFVINANDYLVGDSWSFITYRYNGSIELNEPSIITILEENITINNIASV